MVTFSLVGCGNSAEKYGHKTVDYTALWCPICEQEGHVAGQCAKEIKCNLCGDEEAGRKSKDGSTKRKVQKEEGGIEIKRPLKEIQAEGKSKTKGKDTVEQEEMEIAKMKEESEKDTQDGVELLRQKYPDIPKPFVQNCQDQSSVWTNKQ